MGEHPFKAVVEDSDRFSTKPSNDMSIAMFETAPDDYARKRL